MFDRGDEIARESVSVTVKASGGNGGDGIVGTWNLYYEEDDGVLETIDETVMLQFSSDESLVSNLVSDTYGASRFEGTWHLQGNTLTLTWTAVGQDPDGTVEDDDVEPTDPPNIETLQAEISGNTLTLTGGTWISKWQRI